MMGERTGQCKSCRGRGHSQCLLNTLSQVLFQAVHMPQRALRLASFYPFWVRKQIQKLYTAEHTHSQDEEGWVLVLHSSSGRDLGVGVKQLLVCFLLV